MSDLRIVEEGHDLAKILHTKHWFDNEICFVRLKRKRHSQDMC